MTPRRTASQQRTQVPHSAPGDSRKDALWECHSHGKAHFACGPHQRAHSACERSRRMRFSVRVRAQNALFRRMCFSLPAQTSSHLTEKRTLGSHSHGKAHSAPATPPRRNQKAHSGRATSRKSALCVWASPKGALCMRAVVAPRARFRRSVYTPAYPRPVARPGGAMGPTTSRGSWPP